MSKKLDSNSGMDSDDVWDDIEDDMDILDEEFEEDLLPDSTLEDKDLKKKAKVSSKMDPKKRSSSKIIIPTIGIAILAGGSWFAISENPRILNMLIGMTTGNKYFEQAKVNLDSGQTSQATDNNVKDLSSGSIEMPSPNIEVSLENANALAPENIAILQPDLNEEKSDIQKIPPALVDITDVEDSGFLTPLPSETKTETEIKIDQPIDLGKLNDQSETDPLQQVVSTSEIVDLNKSIEQTGDSLSVTDNKAEQTNPEIRLEEKVLLDQTERAYEEIPNKDTNKTIISETNKTEVPSLKPLEAETITENQPIVTDVDPKAVNIVETIDVSLEQENISKEIVKIPTKDEIYTETSEDKNISKDDVKQITSDKEITSHKKEVPINNNSSSESVAGLIDNLKVVSKTKIQEKVKTEAKKTPTRKWVLRSANSNSAVLLDKLSGNIVSVGIGSHVEGLGKVKSISKEHGKWIVKGTKNSIQQ